MTVINDQQITYREERAVDFFKLLLLHHSLLLIGVGLQQQPFSIFFPILGLFQTTNPKFTWTGEGEGKKTSLSTDGNRDEI
jgi:hypothetical protein